MLTSKRTIKVILLLLPIMILMSVAGIYIISTLRMNRIDRQIDAVLISSVPNKIERRSQLASCVGKRIQLLVQVHYENCKGDITCRGLYIDGNTSLNIHYRFSDGEQLKNFENIKDGQYFIISGIVAYYFIDDIRRQHWDVYQKRVPDYLLFMLVYPKIEQIVDSKPPNFQVKEVSTLGDASITPLQSRDAYLDLRYCLKYLIETGQ